MKVGILSMQRIINYGSFLQAYGLMKTIESLGHEVQFVDYQIEPCIASEKEKSLGEKISILSNKIIRRLKYKNQLEEIKRKDLLNRYNIYLEQLNIHEYKYRSEVDVLVIGSDEVFNCLQTYGGVGYSKELFGARNNAKKVISYAGSFGTSTVDKLRHYGIANEVGELLNKFSAISVRDENSGKIVEALTDKKPIYSLDPVFIYNYDHLITNNVDLKDYIIVYGYSYRLTLKEATIIKKFAKKNNKKLICIGTAQYCCDEIIEANPFELLAYFKNADYIITDTFHGTVFSIKYNKKFATIIRKSNKEKLGDLLSRFNLNDREVTNIDELEKVITKDIDFKYANEKIVCEQNSTIQYLKQQLQ